MAVSYIPKQMAQVSLANAAAVLYTVPAGKSAIVKQLVVTNTSGATASIFLGLVAAGGIGGVANRVIHDVDIPAKSVLTFDISQVLPAGGTVVGHSSAAATLTATLSGLEFA